ncbi:MAG TPA: DUF3027 domain-containing protein [Microbacterium sp.]|uniref:DUF3027 domain-containing protein n=1 Tax=Microbacterium sp. TaxID=51671 RepID=UPI002BEAFCD6|nr:DUF3027 domain-containing protein [Microbacterium sp.]HWI30268.1 DUF3027 domain-containing protein [Microbacterium sp.]
MTSTPDSRLLEAHDLARKALAEITPEATIGDPAGHLVEDDGVLSLLFENRMPGYPGWFWTVTLARVGEDEPTVLEAELLPREGALLAPDWVPWAERLADYQALQAAGAVASEDIDEEQFEDVDDIDATDFDTDGSPILHAGDVDGVDIDVLDETALDEDDDESDDDDEESDDEESDDDDEAPDDEDDDSDAEDDDSDED